jgi:hypothetical protein
MPRVSAAFFVTGGLFVLVGMFAGMYMGAHEDFRIAPAHAHLNLLGWVTMALYGGFYAFTAKTMSKRLAWTNYALSTVGVVIMIPALAMFLTTRDTALVPFMGAGEGLTVLSLLVFLVSAFRELFRNRKAEAYETTAADPMRMAAE